VSVFVPAGSGRLTTSWSGDAIANMTISCWLLLPVSTPSASGWRDIVVLEPNVFLQTYSDGVTIDFGTYGTDHNGQPLVVNTWYHIAMVVAPTSTTNRQIYGYVNGKLQVNVTDGPTFSPYTGFTVGNSIFAPAWTWALNGNVRDLRIWNRALSATDIAREMRASRPVNWSDLLVWSPFDDDLYTDRSGRGLIWTAGGASAPTLQGSMSPRGPMVVSY
jgi:hypothetical protein